MLFTRSRTKVRLTCDDGMIISIALSAPGKFGALYGTIRLS